MSHLPTDRTVADYFDRLRRYARPLKPGDHDRLPTLLILERRLLEALRRARTPAPEADGYAANLGGDGRGGSELTPTESAAQRRIGIRDDGSLMPTEHDVIREQTEQAWGYLQDAVQATGALASVLDRIDRLSSTLSRSEAGGAGSCLACGADVSGAAEDRLKRGLGPCCYSSWIRAGRPELTVFKQQRAS